MKIYGIDFTSAPKPSKPITCLRCKFVANELIAEELEYLSTFEEFDAALSRPGPWIAGLDFPFGLSRKFIENIGWPKEWKDYVAFAFRLGRAGFRKALEDYKEIRPAGDKEHKRKTDILAGSISPQKLYGVPVSLMFFEGAPRLINANVTVPFLHAGDPFRIVVEAYPGVLSRDLIGRASYKSDNKKKQSKTLLNSRVEIFQRLSTHQFQKKFGFSVVANSAICDDPSGDELDALLCAVQAAWAWKNRASNYGMHYDVDRLEGWIAHPIQ